MMPPGRIQEGPAMTATLVSSAKTAVVIGPERRFVMVGEGINFTRRK
jgi:cobalamin-dependent methionine synthase I